MPGKDKGIRRIKLLAAAITLTPTRSIYEFAELVNYIYLDSLKPKQLTMEQSSNESLFDLQLDHEAGSHFRESSKWAKFLSIVYFVAIGLFLLVLLFAAGALINAFQQYAPGFSGAGGFIVAVIVIALGVISFTTLLLFRFAVLTKQGIERQDQVMFNQGLQALKNYFMVYGVLTMLSLIFSVITAVTGLAL